MSTLIRLFTISFISLLLAACGGGGGEISRDNDSGGGTTPPPSDTYSISLRIISSNGEASNQLSTTNPLFIEATVVDGSDSPITGKLVKFEFSNDDLANFDNDTGTALTNDMGVAVIGLRVGANSGSANVIASIDSGEFSSIGFTSSGLDLFVTEPSAVTVEITDALGNPDIMLDVSSPLQVSAKVVNADGESLADQLVTFSLSSSSLASFNNDTGTALTNADGIATIGLLVSSSSGSGKVTASVEGSTDIVSGDRGFNSAGASFSPGEPATVRFSMSNESNQTTNVLSETGLALSILVQDVQGVPLSDELILLGFSIDGLAEFSVDTNTILTNEQGIATVKLFPTKNSGSGYITLTFSNGLVAETGFSSQGIASSVPQRAFLDILLKDRIGAIDTSVAIDNPLTVEVKAVDENGNNIVGQLIYFDFEVEGLATFNNASGTAITNEQGIASIGLIVGENSGSGSVSASTDIAESVSISFTSAGGAGEAGIAYATEMVITDAQGNANNALSVTSPLLVTVTVTDAFGSPVVDELVTFAVSDETLAGFTTAVSSSLTDRNGVATIGLQVGAESGSGLVTASMANGLQDTVGFVSAGTPPPPDTGPASMAVMLVDSDGVSNTALSLTNPLVARVTVLDGDGRGVAGELVTFDFQVAGVARFNNDTGTAVTDAQGIAEIGLVVGDNSGSGTLIASVANGTSTLVSFTSAGGAGEAGIAYNVVVDITGGILSQSNPLTVTASVVDAFGSPVVGELVSFSLSDELVANFSVANASAITDSLGRASIGLEVGEIDGSALVTGAVANGLQSSSAFSSTGPVDSNVAASLDFYVSSERLASSGADSIELIALVRNANSQAFEGAPITFSAPLDDNVNIQVIDRVTRADGTARALLNTLNDATNRTVTVTATTEEFSQDATVVVFGTELTVGSATSSIVIGDIVELTALLVDSDGNPVPNQRVIIASESGLLSLPGVELPEQGTNTITATTDIDGQVLIQYFADISGEDTIYAVVDTPEASAVSEQANLKFVMLVQQDDFKFTSVPASAITLNTPVELIVTWERDGLPLVNSSVTFTSSRGVIDSPTVLTDAQGQAKLSIQSDNAGLASITAVGTDSNGVQVSARTSVDFYADKADRILLGATPDILGPDGQTAAVTAVVRDSNGNVVRNAVVNFVVNDTSGGFISSSQVSTDERGVANAVFTSGAVTSEQQVMITATVKDSDPLVEDFILLTVGNRAFDVSVGTGNIIASPDNSTYLKEFAVFVTDAVGQPIENVQLTASLTPVWFPDGASYSKGDWIWNSDSNLYVQYNYEVDASGNPVFDEFGNLVVIPVQNCLNEDLNNNGELDLNTLPSLDEDDDGNGFLTPGIVGSLTVTDDGTTNEYGQAIVELRYPREFAGWYTADIVVFAQSTGTESSAKTTFRYSIAGADINDQANKPNGSPFGVGRCPVVN